MKSDPEILSKRVIKMTNTECCAAGCGVEYCEAENSSDFSTYFWVGLAIVALVLLAVANANNVSITGSELMDGSNYIDF